MSLRARHRPSGAAIRAGASDASRNMVPGGGGEISASVTSRWHAFSDPEAAVAEVKAEGLIKPTGRIYLQDYVLFLRAAGDKIAFLREYFDPVRAAKAMDTPILGLES